MKSVDAGQPKLRHVLCIYPYRIELGPTSQFYPPLGLEVVAATLQPVCQSIDVVDLRRETKNTTDFLHPDTDLVCFSVNWGYELDFVRSQIRSVPENIRVIVGGRHVTEDPELWLNDCPTIDALVRGHGAVQARELALGTPPADVSGVSYRENGTLKHTQISSDNSVSDSFVPDRKLRKYVYKLDAPDFSTGFTFDTMASSIGCPFNCAFCAFNRNPWGTKQAWSARSPESVVAEIESIDADLVGFVDDNLTHDMKRVERICDMLIERGIKKRYVANARIEIAKHPEVLRKMERAGFSALLVGIESAQDKTLKSMKKGFNTDQIRKYFRVLNKTRMIYHGYFIVGNIGETKEEMLEIVKFARELRIDTLNANLLRNARYSGLDELVEQSPGYHIDDDGFVYSDELSSEELGRIRDTVNQQFYSPRQILRVARKLVSNRLLRLGMLRYLPKFLFKALTKRFNPADRDKPR
jgi:radical SAM superfamily enzyme YgiQ (UPF0313 family)